MKQIISCLFFLFAFQWLLAQGPLDYGYRGVIYQTETTFDIRLHSNGFAFAFNKGDIVRYYLTKYYHFELGFLKHPKESRKNLRSSTVLQSIATANSYIFGKQNSFMVARAGMGNKRYFSERARRKGITMGITYEVGPALGLLKPYYLELKRFDDSRANNYYNSIEKFSEENRDHFLDPNSINGHAGFTRGLSEIKIIPGLQGKFAVHFAWGQKDEFVKAIEGGLMIDVFFQEVPIMIIENNKPYFLNLYLSLQLGKRK